MRIWFTGLAVVLSSIFALVSMPPHARAGDAPTESETSMQIVVLDLERAMAGVEIAKNNALALVAARQELDGPTSEAFRARAAELQKERNAKLLEMMREFAEKRARVLADADGSSSLIRALRKQEKARAKAIAKAETTYQRELKKATREAAKADDPEVARAAIAELEKAHVANLVAIESEYTDKRKEAIDASIDKPLTLG